MRQELSYLQASKMAGLKLYSRFHLQKPVGLRSSYLVHSESLKAGHALLVSRLGDPLRVPACCDVVEPGHSQSLLLGSAGAESPESCPFTATALHLRGIQVLCCAQMQPGPALVLAEQMSQMSLCWCSWNDL